MDKDNTSTPTPPVPADNNQQSAINKPLTSPDIVSQGTPTGVPPPHDPSDNNQQITNNNSSPVPPSNRNMTPWIIAAAATFIAVVAGAFLIFGMSDDTSDTEQSMDTTPTPVAQLSPTIPTPTTATSSATGTLSGQVCYPSSMVPPGTITAKSLETEEVFTQEYLGTQNGGTTSYTFELETGPYNLKFTPVDMPEFEGFYTNYSECIDNSTLPQCTGEETRPLLSALVEEGETLDGVNLCDYYYPQGSPPQF